MFNDIFLTVSILIWLVLTIRYLFLLSNLFQQHEYNNSRFMRSIVSTPNKFFRLHEVVLLIWLFTQLLLSKSVYWNIPETLNWFLFTLTALWSFFLLSKQEHLFVKKLVFTTRLYRLLATSLILIVSEFLILVLMTCPGCNGNVLVFINIKSTQFLIGMICILQLTVLTIILSNLVLSPFNSLINNYYLFNARKKLNAVNPFVIGITGSYGKTSTKHLISEILKLENSESEILSTPKSYNTLLGICRVINEKLDRRHRFFLVEMGTYKPGEIKKICQLVKPKIGVLTAVGPQHLERFKTLQNIAKAKFELIEALPRDGIAIFNGDDPICEELSTISKVKTLLYGTQLNKKLSIKASNISVSIKGTEFDVELNSQGILHVKTQLLGKQNVLNSLAAILIALECGISIKRAVQSLLIIQPFEHRMQLIQTPQGITIIDNAYSSNPVSAGMSLDVMRAIQVKGRKILVTPGFAELGVVQDDEHFKLGQKAAKICDEVFLIGDNKRVRPIMEGLIDKGFSREHVHVNRLLADAQKILREFSSSGDIILFENDLPDIY